MMAHMKTTIELPDDLLIEAKAVAARRRTTLKAMITHALRREIGPVSDPHPRQADLLEVGPFGMRQRQRQGRQHQQNADDADDP